MDLVNKIFAAEIPMKITGPGIDPCGAGGVEPFCGTNMLEQIISQIIGLATIAAVIFFIFQIITAGYAFINSQGDPKAVETAKNKLTYSVLGLVIVVVAVGLGSLIASLLGIQNALNINEFFNSLGK